MLQIARCFEEQKKRQPPHLLWQWCVVHNHTFHTMTFLVPLVPHEAICLHGEGCMERESDCFSSIYRLKAGTITAEWLPTPVRSLVLFYNSPDLLPLQQRSDLVGGCSEGSVGRWTIAKTTGAPPAESSKGPALPMPQRWGGRDAQPGPVDGAEGRDTGAEI